MYNFTFYCSSIKSRCKGEVIELAENFTFYCSSIKSGTGDAIIIADGEPLHSTVVLLKAREIVKNGDLDLPLHSTVVLLKV